MVLVDNHGFASIGGLSETRRRRSGSAPPTGDRAGGRRCRSTSRANAASLGADVIRATTIGELRAALATAKAADATTVVHVETDPIAPAPDAGAWWDVPVAEVSATAAARTARAAYETGRKAAPPHLRPS